MPDGTIILIALFVLACIVAIVLPLAQKAAAASGVDPFADVPTDRETYIRRGQERYNKFSDTNDVTKGNFAGANDAQEMEATNEDLQAVSRTAAMVPDPDAPTYQGVEGVGTRYKVAPPSALLGDARRCEAKKGRDACAALGSEDMKSCGVCIKGGTAYGAPDAEGRHIGGLLILDDDREMFAEEAKNTGRAPTYKPTLGECPDGYFFVDKAECVKAANRQDCKEAGESGGFEGGRNIEGRSVVDKCAAAPLMGDTTYVFDTKGRSFDVFLRVIPPNGTRVDINVNGKSVAFEKEGRYRVEKTKEGTQTTIVVTEKAPYVSKDGVERRAVLLQWEDESGRRRANFEPSLLSVNGRAPDAEQIFANLRKFGTYGKSTQIDGPRGTQGEKMYLTAPWVWSNVPTAESVTFVAKVPGTFLDPVYPEDRAVAPIGPLITQKATMELLRASPCMKPDQKPGKYSLACLKTLFIGSGGDFFKGKLASDGLEKLNRIGDGSAETISGYLTGLYTLATRGKTPAGMKGSMTEINDAAMKMFGFEIVSPCEDIMEDEDGRIKLVPKVGGLEAECLDYLWMNTGNDRSRGNEDGSRYTSLKNTYMYIFDRFSGLRSNEGTKKERAAAPFTACQRTGTMAPIGTNGKPNTVAMLEANSKGSLPAVQDFYSDIHAKANYWGGAGNAKNAVAKAAHDAALEKCYGIKRSGPVSAETVACPKPNILRVGSRISLSPASNLSQFGRHAGYVLWTGLNDGSALFRADASFKVVPALAGTSGAISLEAVNFPGFFITHSWYRALIQKADSTWSRVKETEWFVRPARNGRSDFVSLENNWGGGGWFLGKVGNEIRLVQQSAGADNISWQVKPALG